MNPRTAAFLGIGVNLAWYVLAIGCGVHIAFQRPVSQNWWLLPFVLGAYGGWLPFTLAGFVAAWWGLGRSTDSDDARFLSRVCIASAILSPIVGIASLQLGVWMMRAGS